MSPALSRRMFLSLLAACPHQAAARAGPEVLACVDLLDAHGLSGLSWDGTRLWSVADHPVVVVRLDPAENYRVWRASTAFVPGACAGEQVLTDAEALVGSPDGWWIADEATHIVRRYAGDGTCGERLAVPTLYASALKNRSVEGLGRSEDGRLWLVNEDALPGDGPRSSMVNAAKVRLTAVAPASGRGESWAYALDRVFAEGEGGVSDIAVRGERVLVLERQYVAGQGNDVKVYRVTPGGPGGASDGALETLPLLQKELVVDVAGLGSTSCLPPLPGSTQRGDCLANYEGLAVGPILGDGRQVLFLVSDDNGGSHGQRARVLVVALPTLD